MKLADIHEFICADLPEIKCIPGCIRCCTVALWTKDEWAAVPPERKEKIGTIQVPLRGPGNKRLIALLPVREDQIMPMAMAKKIAVVEIVEEGLLLAAAGLESVRCPFAVEGEGCSVYEYRPFVCRIMGVADNPGRLKCPEKVNPEGPLLDSIVMQRFLLWSNLFEPDTRYTERKP